MSVTTTDDTTLTMTSGISLRALLVRFRGHIALTMQLVLAESIINVLLPLFIGFAINGLLEDSTTGLLHLGALGVLALIIGSIRRLYDTRAYAGIYTKISTEMVQREQEKDKPVSTIAARATLLTEFVEFLENSMPMIVTNIIGVVGILVIVLSLNTEVFLASLALLGLIVLIYVFTGRFNFRLNKGYNDELENQVKVLTNHDIRLIGNHFNLLMRWNIRLSDLETFNYAIFWFGIIGLLVFSPIAVIESGVEDFGTIFSTLTYVFQYIDNLILLPLFIQQIIRLQEISSRLRE
ncbi:MAG: ABC transporter six-transmembrane domain-containing protein [Chloroflexota bacterium]